MKAKNSSSEFLLLQIKTGTFMSEASAIAYPVPPVSFVLGLQVIQPSRVQQTITSTENHNSTQLNLSLQVKD